MEESSDKAPTLKGADAMWTVLARPPPTPPPPPNPPVRLLTIVSSTIAVSSTLALVWKLLEGYHRAACCGGRRLASAAAPMSARSWTGAEKRSRGIGAAAVQMATHSPVAWGVTHPDGSDLRLYGLASMHRRCRGMCLVAPFHRSVVVQSKRSVPHGDGSCCWPPIS